MRDPVLSLKVSLLIILEMFVDDLQAEGFRVWGAKPKSGSQIARSDNLVLLMHSSSKRNSKEAAIQTVQRMQPLACSACVVVL